MRWSPCHFLNAFGCQGVKNWRIAFGVYLAVHPSLAFIRYLYITRERTYSSFRVSVAPPARTADGDRAALNHKPHQPSRPSTDESTQILSCYFSILHSSLRTTNTCVISPSPLWEEKDRASPAFFQWPWSWGFFPPGCKAVVILVTASAVLGEAHTSCCRRLGRMRRAVLDVQE